MNWLSLIGTKRLVGLFLIKLWVFICLIEFILGLLATGEVTSDEVLILIEYVIGLLCLRLKVVFLLFILFKLYI